MLQPDLDVRRANARGTAAEEPSLAEIIAILGTSDLELGKGLGLRP